MKVLITALFMFSSVSALACMAGGKRMTDGEKSTFAKDIEKLNPKCAKLIKRKIGDLKKTDVNMWVQSSDNLKEYTVIGFRSQMDINYLKVMGKMQYSCGPVTPLKRGC